MTNEQKNKGNNNASKNIIANIANEDNARKFLDDLFFDMENAGGLEWTVDGLVMLLDSLANKEAKDIQPFIERLQLYLYSWISHRPKNFSSYLKKVKAGKDYRDNFLTKS